ncbi:MAG TPA: hypothetical protein VHP35_04580 [Terriglobia bacterium]|nr:hypothetical protein [Terriglobia bacterium]
MSYFKKIVERTLKAADSSGSLKPAITPDSIPEPFEIKTRAGTSARRFTASSTRGSAKKQQPPDDPRPAPDAKAAGEEERLPEQVVMGTAAAAPVSPTKQVAQETPQDKAAAPDPDMMPDYEQAEVPTEKEGKKPDFTAVAAAPIVLHETTEVGGADPTSRIEQLERRSVVVSKDSPGPEHHHRAQLRPATRADDKYYVAETQADETTVTVNIGRIEVRAVTPVETRSLSRKEYYSPPLSLSEYLKQRMEEGKKK